MPTGDELFLEAVLEAARSVRPQLPSLVGAEAAALDAELAALLARTPSDAAVAHEILAVLERRPAAHAWAASFIEVSTGTARGFAGLPGHPETPRADRLQCPMGDYVWYRRSLGQPQPRCPTHPDLELVAGTSG